MADFLSPDVLAPALGAAAAGLYLARGRLAALLPRRVAAASSPSPLAGYLVEFRHAAAERPKGDREPLLDACDVLEPLTK